MNKIIQQMSPFVLKVAVPACLILLVCIFLLGHLTPWGYFRDLSSQSHDGVGWYNSALGNWNLISPVILYWWLSETILVICTTVWLKKAPAELLNKNPLAQVLLCRCGYYLTVLPIVIAYVLLSTHGHPALSPPHAINNFEGLEEANHQETLVAAVQDILIPFLNPLPIAITLLIAAKVFKQRKLLAEPDLSSSSRKHISYRILTTTIYVLAALLAIPLALLSLSLILIMCDLTG